MQIVPDETVCESATHNTVHCFPSPVRHRLVPFEADIARMTILSVEVSG
jgi:hypothetical protein